MGNGNGGGGPAEDPWPAAWLGPLAFDGNLPGPAGTPGGGGGGTLPAPPALLLLRSGAGGGGGGIKGGGGGGMAPFAIGMGGGGGMGGQAGVFTGSDIGGGGGGGGGGGRGGGGGGGAVTAGILGLVSGSGSVWVSCVETLGVGPEVPFWREAPNSVQELCSPVATDFWQHFWQTNIVVSVSLRLLLNMVAVVPLVRLFSLGLTSGNTTRSLGISVRLAKLALITLASHTGAS